MQVQRWAVWLLVGCLALGTTACSDSDAPAGEEGGGSVSFVDLADGDTVGTPFEACLEVSGLEIAPSGEVVEGAGHHHILVNPSDEEMAAYADGTVDVIPNDETHIHMGDGSTCKELELPPGEHTLVAVVADGVHAPLDPPVMTSVTINVEE